MAGVALLALLSGGCYPLTFHGRTVVPDATNYWHQPTGTIHVAPNQSERVYWHEWCHGWQGEGLDKSDVGLVSWKHTTSGADFNGSLEQAADVCAYYCMLKKEPSFFNKIDTNFAYDYIDSVDPSWAAWAERWVVCPSDQSN